MKFWFLSCLRLTLMIESLARMQFWKLILPPVIFGFQKPTPQSKLILILSYWRFASCEFFSSSPSRCICLLSIEGSNPNITEANQKLDLDWLWYSTKGSHGKIYTSGSLVKDLYNPILYKNSLILEKKNYVYWVIIVNMNCYSYYTQCESYRIFQSSWSWYVCASKSLLNPLYETRGHGSAHLGDWELVMVLHSILQTGLKWQYEVNRDTTPKSEKEQNREEKKKIK